MSDLSIVDPKVAAALSRFTMQYEVLECDPALADTAEFCAHYGISADEACNAIVIVLKTTPRQYAGCLVRADSKLDVNHKVAAALSFKRLSFASAEETAGLSGMMIGGVTVVGLPDDVPLLIDTRVLERPTVILGGGNRSSKIRLDPNELLKIPGARVADIAVSRNQS
jgi:prolyl-tRNA editing enzyme YbaK/EbsC (Cys-tRNA(Pro) deacylase)